LTTTTRLDFPAPALFAELILEFGGSNGPDRAAQEMDERAKRKNEYDRRPDEVIRQIVKRGGRS